LSELVKREITPVAAPAPFGLASLFKIAPADFIPGVLLSSYRADLRSFSNLVPNPFLGFSSAFII
jgi:hypothetical protein